MEKRKRLRALALVMLALILAAELMGTVAVGIRFGVDWGLVTGALLLVADAAGIVRVCESVRDD